MPKPKTSPILSLSDLAVADQAHNLKLSPTLAKLHAGGLKTVQEVLEQPQSLRRILGRPSQVKRRAVGLIKLTRASGDADLAARVLYLAGPSLAEIARLPQGFLESGLGKLDAAQSRALHRLQRQARAAYRVVSETALLHQAALSRTGSWLLDREPKPTRPIPTPCFDCDCCGSVFGPRAYLFDLLDLIYYRWPLSAPGLKKIRRLTSDLLEKILCQEIDSLDCSRGEELVPQVRLACEVLERFLDGKIPLTDNKWRTDYRRLWASLLAPGSDPETAIQALSPLADGSTTPIARLAQALIVSRPTLATLDAASLALNDLRDNPGILPASLATILTGPGFGERQAALLPELLLAYRHHLISASGKSPQNLGRQLFWDLQVGGCQKTTRFTQLIVSLQEFILAIRTGEIKNVDRADLPRNLINFSALDPNAIEEEEWNWLGDYSTWKSAMYALIFPENVLPPPLKEYRLENLARQWSAGVTPQDIREGFLKIFFGPALTTVRNLNTALSRQVFDTPSFPTTYGDLHAWIADIERLAAVAPVSVSDFPYPPLKNDSIVYLNFPLLAGWALNRAGAFAAAHDWYRLLYDPNHPRQQRVRFDFDAVLEVAPGTNPETIRPAGAAWLDDPLDPKLIARRRRGVYLRHAVLAMVRNLLDWADHEYALETAESVARARALYLLAQRTLDAPEIQRCGDTVRFLEFDIIIQQGFQQNRRLRRALRASLRRLRQVQHRQVLDDAVSQVRTILSTSPDSDVVGRIDEIVRLYLEKDSKLRPDPSMGKSLSRRRLALGQIEDKLLVGFQPDPGNGGFGPGLPGAPEDPFDWFRQHPDLEPDLPDDDDLRPDIVGQREVGTGFLACIPANPVLISLNQHISANLTKIRQCLNIVGEPLQLQLVTCDPAAGKVTTLTPSVAVEAPRYRYSFLVDKARQYVDVAQRLETALLQALEKREQARFDLLKARQAADLAAATVELRTLQVREAETGLDVTELQLERAQIQTEFWDNRLGDAENADDTLSDLEKDGLFWTDVSWKLQAGAAAANAAMVLPQIAMAAAGGAATLGGGIGAVATSETGIGAVAGGIVAVAGAATMSLSIFAGLPGIAGALSAAGGAAGTYANMQQTKAAFERRFEEWTLQRDLAQADSAIAYAAVTLAQDRVAIADQEEEIARLQLNQAREILEFLHTRLDNLELFEWMIDVLLRNYRSLMYLSTSVARLAQRALEFERQEPIQIILPDYWSIANTSALAANLSQEQSSYGLLGAERLLADLTKLDAYKLQTEKRRLQLTKTISLAQTLPVEFAQLRRSGQITFNTLLDSFDQDFPGHYLRLLRSVRVSVLALIPPLDGIHATLHNGGESSVVIPVTDAISGEVTFEKRRALRNFGESIALDAAFNESGLFELRPDDPLLLPFEGLGAETQWTLELPQAFNRFNFATIADVLLHLDYTALLDLGYRQQVIAALPSRQTTDSAFDLGFAFPDAWYQLKNPRPTDPPADREMPFVLPRAFFPPQFAAAPVGGPPALQVKHAALILVGNFSSLSQSQRQKFKDAVEIVKDGLHISTTTPSVPGSPAFRSAEITNNSAFFTTREAAAALSPSHFPPDPAHPGQTLTDAVGAWSLRLRSPVFTEMDDEGQPLIRRLINAMLVITLEGGVFWG